MGLSATIDAQISYLLTGAPDFGAASHKYDGWGTRDLGNGTSAQQADRIYSKTITLSASATQDIDLSGALLDPIGGSAVFVKVKAIAIRARDANTNNVVLGNAASNGFVGPFGSATHTVALPPGGNLILTAPASGWTVTAGTGDLLRVANSGAGTSVTFDIIIIGTSA